MTLDFQWISLIVFVLILTITVILKRKNIELQKILFPVLYAGLYRTNFGLKFIDRFSARYKEWIKVVGYCGIGIGFFGMIFIIVGLIQSIYLMLTQPSAQAGVALVLPQTNIPGIGFLPFWYWIIALFVIVLIHEFSHGIVAKAHGLKIKSSGLGFFAILLPLFPIAFVEPDEKEMEKKQDHIQYSIFAAGPFSNIITAIIILFIFLFIFAPLDSMLTQNVGVSFTSINDSYPSASIPDNTLITNLNNRTVKDTNDLITGLQCLKPGQNITLGNINKTYSLTTVPSAQEPESAFIGITNIKTVTQVRQSADNLWYSIYVWIRGLFKWIGLLSFFVGLANLLPIGPIDGGRMIKLLSEKVSKNKEAALKGWITISLIFVLIILFLLVYPLLINLI